MGKIDWTTSGSGSVGAVGPIGPTGPAGPSTYAAVQTALSASAGATTVSLDLNSKWLDRIKPQMEANGIDVTKHDTIFGDCKLLILWQTSLALCTHILWFSLLRL